MEPPTWVPLATIQGFGNLGASAIAGLIWTAASPRAAFSYLAIWSLIAVACIFTAINSDTRAADNG